MFFNEIDNKINYDEYLLVNHTSIIIGNTARIIRDSNFEKLKFEKLKFEKLKFDLRNKKIAKEYLYLANFDIGQLGRIVVKSFLCQ